ncbi:hypothetical protein OsJ_34184 [Oryza sativa Japonica Group]|uniref:Uncharacterized protein n=1 Tax=Oryza sativa subsp. japonica TaxID=39947 RepID=B9GB36_ORYSJ|nr:hypothetical protein OsJ_34184 [Oryza sativa Japonica Group]
MAASSLEQRRRVASCSEATSNTGHICPQVNHHIEQIIPHNRNHKSLSSLPNTNRQPRPAISYSAIPHGVRVECALVAEVVGARVYNDIVRAAAIVFRCDAVEKDLYEHLQHLGRHLKNVSGIDYENWGTVKLATAFKIICSRKIDKSDEMFSDDVRSKLLDDADKYKDLVFRTGLNILRNDKVDQLAELVKVARIKAEHVRVKPMLNRSLNLLQAK